MKAALAIVIAVGIGIGLMIPAEGRKEDAPAPEAAPQAAAAVETAPAAAPSASWGGETRLKRAEGGHFYATALVNGQPVEFVVDTGATTVALTVEDARRIGIPVDPGSFEVIGSGASGPVRGQNVTIDRVSLDGKEVRTLRGAVLEGLEVSLLGQAYLSRIGSVTMSGGEMVLR
jgi:aspartyl protease family protein